MIDVLGWDLDGLSRRYREARPFPHLVLDGVLGEAGLATLKVAFAAEPHFPTGGEIYELLSSSDPPQHPELKAFLAALSAGPAATALRAITGKRFEHIEGRAYCYGQGHYLLPHTDCRKDLDRRLAFVFYVACEGLEGGELELFEVGLEGGEVVSTAPLVRIAPQPDRLVVFDVSRVTLHQVLEVRRGWRGSIAGWLLG